MVPFRPDPRRPSRILPVLGLFFGAPVCAEYLQAYLPSTGALGTQLLALLILGPLYGGAALLVRELAVHTGRGWPGVLLLAAAFGVLMAGLVDLSLWTEHRSDVPYWDSMRTGTLIAPLGFAGYPFVSWVTGHVLFSVGVPLALLDALAPHHRGRPLLGRAGVVVVALLGLLAAVLIHLDARDAATGPTPAQAASVAITVVTLIGLALSPAGRPVARRDDGTGWTPHRLALAAFAAALALDLLPWTWAGTLTAVALLGLTAVTVTRAARARSRGPPHVTALAAGALVERCVVGFLSPLPPGVAPAAKFAQVALLLLLVGAVAWVAWQRVRTRVEV